MTSEIEVPDREDAACALDKLELGLARLGDYEGAGMADSAARRLRLDDEEIREKDAEIERLRRIVDAEQERVVYRNHVIDQRNAMLTEANAEIERLRADVVWACRNGAWYGRNLMRGYLLHTFVLDEDGDLCGDDRIDCDGTDAGILAAVRQARGGE